MKTVSALLLFTVLSSAAMARMQHIGVFLLARKEEATVVHIIGLGEKPVQVGVDEAVRYLVSVPDMGNLQTVDIVVDRYCPASDAEAILRAVLANERLSLYTYERGYPGRRLSAKEMFSREGIDIDQKLRESRQAHKDSKAPVVAPQKTDNEKRTF